MTVPVPDQLEFISDGNGVIKEFSYPRRFLQKDEIVVAFRKDNSDTIKSLNIDYTIAGSSWPNGGSIVFTVAPPVGVKVVRYRMTQAKQTVDLNNNQRNDSKAVEVQLDRLTMAIQDRGSFLTRLWDWLSSTAAGLKTERAERIAGDAALNGRVNKEITDRENGDKAVASLIGQAGSIEVPFYDTRSAASLAVIKATVQSIQTGGDNATGDAPLTVWKKSASRPTHSRWFRSADGAYWENTRPVFFILATGQSNIAIARSKQWAPRKNIWRWNNADAVDGSIGNQFVQVSTSNVQVSSVFADSLARENPGMDFYILNVGFGGREINHWLPGASAPDVYANITANIAGALTAAGVSKVNQMLWWQGEADYFTSTLPLYEAKFELLIARFQIESWFDQSSPIFIFGTANAAQGGHANYDLINLILQRCGSNDPTRRQFFYTSMLPSDFWEDNLHPNADGVYLVAQMAAHQFLGRAGKFGYGMTVNPADGSVSLGKTLYSRSMLTVSRNDAYSRDLGSPSLLHLIPGDADINSRFLHEAFATSVQWSARRANGTLAIPQSLKSGDVLLDLATAGYNGSSYTSLTGGLQVRASSDWTASSTSTNVRILVVPAGSTVQATAARFNENLDAIFTRSVIFKPPSEPVLEENGQVSIGRPTNTSLVFRARGTDGIIRSATITLT